MNKHDLIDEFTEYAKTDIEGALQVITGLFVGINEAYVDLKGIDGDSKKQITIEGGSTQRKITLHPYNTPTD